MNAPSLNGYFALYNVPADTNQGNQGNQGNTPSNPSNTGDALMIGLWALLLAALAAAIVCIKKLRDVKR